MRYKGLLFFITVILTSPFNTAYSAGNITDGGVTFGYTSFGVDAPNANLTGTLSGDQVFEYGWFFRLAGGTQETALGDPTSEDYTGNTATIDWAGVGGVLDVTETTVVTEVAAGQGTVDTTLTVVNTSAMDQTVNLFHFADIDVTGTFGDDSAALTNSPDFITVTDGGGSVEYRAGGNNFYAVAPFAGLEPLLTDGNIDNFADTGLPFGPGDVTSAFQWSDFVIPAGGVLTVSVALGSGTPSVAPPGPTLLIPPVMMIEPQQVPTLSQYGVLLLIMLLGFVMVSRKNRI